MLQAGHLDKFVILSVCGVKLTEYFDGVTTGKSLIPLADGLGNDPAPDSGCELLPVIFGKPGGNLSPVDLHFQELEIFITIHLVLRWIGNPFQQRFGFQSQARGNNDPGKVLKDPWQKTPFDVFSKNVFVYLDFSVAIQHVQNFDMLNPIGKGRDVFNVDLIFRVHQSDEKRVDILLHILHFVKSLADNIVQLDEPVHIMRFDVHQCIDSVVGFGITGIEIVDLVAVPEKAVQTVL